MEITDIESRLKSHFGENTFLVEDLSGDRSKLQISVRSEKFKGLNRIKQHQLVMSLFSDELKSGEIHAMTLKTEAI